MARKRNILFLKCALYFFILLGVIFLFRLGYQLPWTGFSGQQFGEVTQPPKLLWDWLELMIIPIILSLGAVLLTGMDRRQDTAIAHDRLRESSFQAYLTGMAELILDYHLGEHNDKAVGIVARARTLAVLKTLDPDRKGVVIQFLFVAGLILGDDPIISLVGANCRE